MAEITAIQFLRGSESEWSSANPVLAAGKPGYELDTHKIKIGDGSTAWNSLPYVGASYRGDYGGTTTLPTTGGGGVGGLPVAGDRWRLTNTLVVGGNVYAAGTVIEAAANTPGQTLTNWIFYSTQL